MYLRKYIHLYIFLILQCKDFLTCENSRDKVLSGRVRLPDVAHKTPTQVKNDLKAGTDTTGTLDKIYRLYNRRHNRVLPFLLPSESGYMVICIQCMVFQNYFVIYIAKKNKQTQNKNDEIYRDIRTT